jgi:Family of unknown function (DUF5684)
MFYDGSSHLGLFFVLLAAYLGFIGIILLTNYVLYAIALMLFFRKVGVDEWIAWVPYYRYWKWLEVEGQPGYFSLFGIVPALRVVTLIFLYIGMWSTGKAFGKDAGMLVLGIFLPFVWLFVLAARGEVYRPELITAAGYPPPRAGYGSLAYAAAHPTSPPPPPAV